MTYLIYLHHLLLYAALLLHSATPRCYARTVSYDTCAIPLRSWRELAIPRKLGHVLQEPQKGDLVRTSHADCSHLKPTWRLLKAVWNDSCAFLTAV